MTVTVIKTLRYGHAVPVYRAIAWEDGVIVWAGKWRHDLKSAERDAKRRRAECARA